MKRTASEPSTSDDVAPKRATKKPGPSNNQNPIEPPLQQGRIYFTPIGGITGPLYESEGALSLNEILSITRPIKSLHCSFMIDADYLMGCYPPSIRSNPITLVVGSPDAPDLRKSMHAFKNATVIGASLPIPYGTHHSKLSILEGEDGNVHVIVSSANMVSEDWEFKTQQFWYGYGIKKETVEEVTGSEFQEDLSEYLSYYPASMNSWKELIKCTDFSDVKDRLIFSVPGYHKEKKDSLGHMRLRNVLIDRFPFNPDYVHTERTSFFCQCSSIGSLGATPANWFRGQFLQSLEGAATPPKNKPARIFVVFPRVEDIRMSAEGYAGGGSVPYRNSVHQRQLWLQDAFCRWKADNKKRTRAIPHCKTYMKMAKEGQQWQLLTSANLSKAAWGELQKVNTANEQLMIRSYEMGVLITDPERFNIPFDYPCVAYNDNDQPFTVDSTYTEPDCLGNAMNAQSPRKKF